MRVKRLPTWLVALLAVLAPTLARADPPKVVIDPAPAGIKAAPDYRVSVGGREVFVYDTEVCAYATFAADGPVCVTVTPTARVHAAVVRPLSKGIVPTVGGGRAVFTAEAPANLGVEFDGDRRRPLFLFVNRVEPQSRPAGPKVRYFEPGKVHDAGEIRLGSGETLFIPGGAVVRGTVVAEGAENVRILGHGILDGSTRERKQTFVALLECRNVTISGPIFVDSIGWNIHLRGCENATLTGVRVIGWRPNCDGLDVDGSRHVRVTDCFFRSADDCIALKALATPLRDVEVRRATLWNGWYGNATEIGFELRALEASDLRFVDCDILRVEGGAAFGIHVGDGATVSGVRYENIRVEDAGELIDLFVGLSIYSADAPARWSTRTEGTPQHEPIPPDRQARPGTADDAFQWIKPLPGEVAELAKARGHIRDVVFKDIRVTGGRFPTSRVGGFDAAHTAEGVVADGLWIDGKRATTAAGAKLEVRDAPAVSFTRPPR